MKCATISLVLLLAASIVAATAGHSSAASIVWYVNDFEGAAGAEWSHTTTDSTPWGQRRFLGQFCNDMVTLSLPDLPEHTELEVSFDLFVIRTWDGSGDDPGDVWHLGIQDGPTLLHTTFSNGGTTYDLPQTYPGNLPGTDYPARTGATENGTLGYTYTWMGVLDSVYSMSYTFQHSAASVGLEFLAQNLTSITNESWGLDNVVVSYALVPAELLGDLNGDGFVGQIDLSIVLTYWGENVTPGDPLLGDPSGDGFVGQTDIDTVLGNWGASDEPEILLGDLNDDGWVGQIDLSTVLTYWGSNVTAGDPLMGDPSGDGLVGQADLDHVLGDWGQGTALGVPVPGPATLSLLLLGCLDLLRPRRR